MNNSRRNQSESHSSTNVNPFTFRNQVPRRGARWHLCLICDWEFYCTHAEWNRHKHWCVWDHFVFLH